MAGAFSGHLLNAFNSAQPIVSVGAMSFDVRAHGTPGPSSPPTLFGFTPLTEDSTTAKQIATLQAKLNRKLGPEYISQRPGPGGGSKLTYAEGWKIINLANEVFGFNGWSSSVVSIMTDFVDYSEDSKRFNVGVTAIVRVTLRDGAFHEDVGYGLLENSKSKGGALDKCKKEAITDALKRTLRNFGNLLGNCLYDKSYTQEVVKIKVPPAKFDKSDLYRRPEFEERMLDSLAPRDHTAVSESSSTECDKPRVKVEHEGRQPETPVTYVPRHLRQEMAIAAQQAQSPAPVRTLTASPHRAPAHPHAHVSASGSGAVDGTINCGPPSVNAPKSSGLATPIQTPAQTTRPAPPRAPPPRAIATSPLARMCSVPGRSVSFAEPMPARAGSVDPADKDMDNTAQENGDGGAVCDEDEDAFPLSTQDDAFLATVDLGAGDLGRPIDFEEGMGDPGMMDVSALEPGPDIAGQSPIGLPQPQPNMRPAQPTAKPFLSVTTAASAANANAVPNTSSGQSRPQLRGGPLNMVSVPLSTSTSTSGTRADLPAQDVERPRPAMTSIGGFRFPPDMKPPTQQPQQHTLAPAVSPCVRTTPNSTLQTGPTNTLKRSVDVMQAGLGSSTLTRPPIRGMGLAQRQPQQNAIARRLSDSNEGNDPKRLKR